MNKAISALAVAGLLVGAASAEAKSVKYAGKTTSGHKITFKKSGNRIKNVKSGTPVVCLPGTTGYSSRAGADVFNPPGAFRVGTTTKRKKLQKTGMWYSKVTKNYKVTTKKAGNKIKGKLHMSFSYAMPVFDYWGARLVIYACSGDTKFTARPR